MKQSRSDKTNGGRQTSINDVSTQEMHSESRPVVQSRIVRYCALRRRTAQHQTGAGLVTRPDAVPSSKRTNKPSVVPEGRYPTKDVAVERHTAHGREGQVSGHQCFAGSR